MQNEKRKLLMEHETLKLKELDEEYAKDIREWKAHLKPRKQVKKSPQRLTLGSGLLPPLMSKMGPKIFN